jgi:hypothetical protein
MTSSSFPRYHSEWVGGAINIRRDVLAGMVGTFALIPEVIAFSFVAGVDPEVGLFASFVIGIVIAFAGGRPAMISGAAGSVALVAAALVGSHGLKYLLAATLLAGLLQIVFGLLKLDVLMRFVSRSVRTGFVNALAILIFSAQVPQMLGATWHTYAMIGLGLAIIYLVPRLTTAIPSPLICIVVLTVVAVAFPMPIHSVADLGRLPNALPTFSFRGGAAGVYDDRQRRRRLDGDHQFQGPRMHRAWPCQHSCRPVRRNRRLRHDRPDRRQCALWRPRPAVDAGGRCLPADRHGATAAVGGAGTRRRTRGDHDHGVDQHLLLGLDP